MSSTGRTAQQTLQKRREVSDTKLDRFRDALKNPVDITGNACVYAIGSFGRREASDSSDLDLFIASRVPASDDKDRSGEGVLAELDATLLRADLIQACRHIRFPDFSGQGKFLTLYPVDSLVKTTGLPTDDATNTLTARLLLLLESKPIIGPDTYDFVLQRVVDAYWKDFAGHEKVFMPAFVVNDILRLWRTFCVNYETKNVGHDIGGDEAKAKMRLNNYKLKYPRLLTCFSGILYLLSRYVRAGTVTREDAIQMASLTPTERIEWLASQHSDDRQISVLASSALSGYETFLDRSSAGRDAVKAALLDTDRVATYFEDAKIFGNNIFDLTKRIGEGNALYRRLVV